MSQIRWGWLSEFILGLRIKSFLFLLAILSWINCLALFSLVVMLNPHQRPGYYPDSHEYETIANNIVAGAGFSLSSALPYEPTMGREPLYPALLALFKAAFGDNIDGVVFLQIIVNPLIAILVYLIGKQLFDEKVTRLSSLLVAVNPIYGDISYSIMSEEVFMILFLTTVLALTVTAKRGQAGGYIICGTLLGLSSLCKNVVLPLAIVYPAVIILNQRGAVNRRMAVNVVLFLVSFSLMTTPWMLRNKQELGIFNISVRGGALFSNQAFWAANFTSEEWKAYGLYLVSGTLAQKLYPQIIGSSLGGYEYSVLMRKSYMKQFSTTHKEGELERILLSEGLDNVIQHPFRYLFLSALVELQTLKYLIPYSLMANKGPAQAEWLFPMVRASLLLIGIIFIVLTLRGIAYSKNRFRDYLLVLVTIVYFHFASASLGIIPGAILRYILPVTVFYPFFIIVAILGPASAARVRVS